jgi:hypothetical protein
MDGINEGRMLIKSCELPSFLYDSKVKYDPNDRANGLLRGDVLIRVCFLYLSPLPV